MKTKLSFKEAKRLSIIKWKCIIENRGYSPDREDQYPPEIVNISNHCGFCERWHDENAPEYFHRCEKCEFYKAHNQISCFNSNKGLFRKWCEIVKANDSNKLSLAKDILKLIESIPIKQRTKKIN